MKPCDLRDGILDGIPRLFASNLDMEIAVFLSRAFVAMDAAGHGKAQLPMIRRFAGSAALAWRRALGPFAIYLASGDSHRIANRIQGLKLILGTPWRAEF